MSDILYDIRVSVECRRCDSQFEVPAAVVAESQEMLEQGCPGSAHECPAPLFAELIDKEALRRLVEAWRDVEASVSRSPLATSCRVARGEGR